MTTAEQPPLPVSDDDLIRLLNDYQRLDQAIAALQRDQHNVRVALVHALRSRGATGLQL